jgi:hypothetical protein
MEDDGEPDLVLDTFRQHWRNEAAQTLQYFMITVEILLVLTVIQLALILWRVW